MRAATLYALCVCRNQLFCVSNNFCVSTLAAIIPLRHSINPDTMLPRPAIILPANMTSKSLNKVSMFSAKKTTILPTTLNTVPNVCAVADKSAKLTALIASFRFLNNSAKASPIPSSYKTFAVSYNVLVNRSNSAVGNFAAACAPAVYNFSNSAMNFGKKSVDANLPAATNS